MKLKITENNVLNDLGKIQEQTERIEIDCCCEEMKRAFDEGRIGYTSLRDKSNNEAVTITKGVFIFNDEEDNSAFPRLIEFCPFCREAIVLEFAK